MNGNLLEVFTPMQGLTLTLLCIVAPLLAGVAAEALARRADRKRARRYAEALEYINKRAK